jgi:hypothetical protein
MEDTVRAQLATGDHGRLAPAARSLRDALARQLVVLAALALAALALGGTLLAATAAATAVAFAIVGGGLVVARQRAAVDDLIGGGHDAGAVLGLARRCRHLRSPRLRRALARSLRHRAGVRDRRLLAEFGALAARLEAPDPVAPRGMVRLLALLRSAPAAVAVGSPDAVLREISAIRYLLDDRAADGCAC